MDPISAMRLPAMIPGGMAASLPPITGPKISAQELASLGSASSAQPQNLQSGRAFSDFLGDMAREVNAKQASAGQAVEGVLSGENIPLHQAMIAVEEASVSFQLMVEVRNKLLESYQELMRMQI
jgi:flagellar hook-basal body complex protein FliE